MNLFGSHHLSGLGRTCAKHIRSKRRIEASIHGHPSHNPDLLFLESFQGLGAEAERVVLHIAVARDNVSHGVQPCDEIFRGHSLVGPRVASTYAERLGAHCNDASLLSAHIIDAFKLSK
jgi:hypothetical protein